MLTWTFVRWIYVRIFSSIYKTNLSLSRKVRKIGNYLNRPPLRNGSMNQVRLFIMLSALSWYTDFQFVSLNCSAVIEQTSAETEKMRRFEMRRYFTLSFSLLLKTRIKSLKFKNYRFGEIARKPLLLHNFSNQISFRIL